MARRYDHRAVYVGNLPGNIRESEIDDLFRKFGRIRVIDLKTPTRPPAYAFVEFEDARDAEEAARRRNNYDFYGNRIRVEIARGGGPSLASRDTFKPPRNSSGYRVTVKGLPRSASWQDLKDHFRSVVRPMYTEVFRDRDGDTCGIVEFETYDDMKLAIRKLDDTEFKNPFDKGCYIRITEDSSGGRRGRSRSRSRSRSPRRSRSASRRRSMSRSPSRSPARRASRSPARRASRSRSRSMSRDKARSASPRSRSPSRERRASPSPARSDRSDRSH